MVLVTQATSKDSGEPAHPRSLARAFAVCTQGMEVDDESDQIRHQAALDAAHAGLE